MIFFNVESKLKESQLGTIIRNGLKGSRHLVGEFDTLIARARNYSLHCDRGAWYRIGYLCREKALWWGRLGALSRNNHRDHKGINGKNLSFGSVGDWGRSTRRGYQRKRDAGERGKLYERWCWNLALHAFMAVEVNSSSPLPLPLQFILLSLSF